MVEKRKDAYSRLQNLQLQKVLLLMLMKVWMNEKQSCHLQVHVTALRCLRVKPRKRGLNKRLKSVLRGWGAGSHTLPNHVIGKRMVNMTLLKGHHA